MLVAAIGYVAFRALKWVFTAGNQANKKSSPLSSTDLRVLEESTQRLTRDLRQVTDECVARIQKACDIAEDRLEALERAASQQSFDSIPQEEEDIFERASTIPRPVSNPHTEQDTHIVLPEPVEEHVQQKQYVEVEEEEYFVPPIGAKVSEASRVINRVEETVDRMQSVHTPYDGAVGEVREIPADYTPQNTVSAPQSVPTDTDAPQTEPQNGQLTRGEAELLESLRQMAKDKQ